MSGSVESISDFEIRPIRDGDVLSFHRLFDSVARERKYLAFLEAPPIDAMRAFVLDNISRGNPQFVAVAGAEIVGWCDVIAKVSTPVFTHSATLGVGLAQGFRHCGLGRQLMSRAISAAFASGLTRIDLTVRADNENAIALYKKFGFEVEGTHRNAIRLDGKYHDRLSMALLKP